jgi:MYXO-CTERM domain-containing protein
MGRLILALALLIGTTRTVHAQEIVDPADADNVIDAGNDPTGDADPGPLLPNGEPAPPPDLASDTGGCSCRVASTAPFPPALAIAAALLLRRNKKTNGRASRPSRPWSE